MYYRFSIQYLVNLFPSPSPYLRSLISDINWSVPQASFPLMVRLLDLPTYRYPSLLGTLISVGGLTESTVCKSLTLGSSINISLSVSLMVSQSGRKYVDVAHHHGRCHCCRNVAVDVCSCVHSGSTVQCITAGLLEDSLRKVTTVCASLTAG